MLTYPDERQARDQASVYRQQGYMPTVKRINSDWAVNRGRYLGEIAAGSFESRLNIEEAERETRRVGTIAIPRYTRGRVRDNGEDEEEASRGIQKPRTEAETARYASRKIQTTRPSEVTNVADVVTPKVLRQYWETARETGAQQGFQDTLDFLNFYARLANPDVRVSDEEINKWARKAIPGLRAEAKRLTDQGGSGFGIEDTLEDIANRLETGDRMEKVLAIDELANTEHIGQLSVLPHTFDSQGSTTLIFQVLQYLSLTEREKEEYLQQMEN